MENQPQLPTRQSKAVNLARQTNLNTTKTNLNTTRRIWIPRDGFEYHETDSNTTSYSKNSKVLNVEWNVYCTCIMSAVSKKLHYVFIAKCNILLKFKPHTCSDICLDGLFWCEELALEICPSSSDTPSRVMKMPKRTHMIHVCTALTISLLFKRKHPTYSLQIHIYCFQRTAARDKLYF